MRLSDAAFASMPNDIKSAPVLSFDSFTGIMPAMDLLQKEKWGLSQKANSLELYPRSGCVLIIR